LKDLEYVKLVKKSIKQVVEMYAATPYLISNLHSIHPRDIEFTINDMLFFEMILLEIRAKTISYSAFKHKELDKIERELELEIQTLFEKVGSGDHDLSEQLNRKQAELENLRKDKMNGVLIRSKARWFEHGEKPSKYFLNMEKRNVVNKSIKRIVTTDGSCLTDSKEIVLEARKFYNDLYAERVHVVEDSSNIDLIFANSETPILSDSERDSLEGPITYQELLAALKNSKNGKSPGSDGFSFEFYKVFFSDLAWYLLRSLNYAYVDGKLSPTQNYGIITLLPKGDKPRQY
jgi:hypothetical protein